MKALVHYILIAITRYYPKTSFMFIDSVVSIAVAHELHTKLKHGMVFRMNELTYKKKTWTISPHHNKSRVSINPIIFYLTNRLKKHEDTETPTEDSDRLSVYE